MRLRLLAAAALACLLASSAQASDFYKGKTITIVHGFASGGAFDTSARLIASYLGRHIAGNPSFIVQSTPGAGGLLATNYVFKIARPDGLTIGYIGADNLVMELLGAKGVQFDSSKFVWLASPTSTTAVCVTSKKSGVNSLADWRSSKRPVIMGTQALYGNINYDIVKLISSQADLPTKIVPGYKGGNPDLKLAVQRGEIDGFCGSLDSISTVFGESLLSSSMNVLIQAGEEPDPKIMGTPQAKDILVTPDGAQLIDMGISIPGLMERAFIMPPGTPKEASDALRQGLMDTFRDQEFLAAARKAQVQIHPIAGATLQNIVEKLHAVSPALRGKLRDVLEAGTN